MELFLNMVKVSIVIPVYNTEKYIRECLDSVINQTLKEIEIILIDDGSIDSSGLLCDAWVLKDNRVKVIHQANQGLSGARNTGIDNASGEYIFFCDSDDFIRKDTIERLYGKL